MKKYLFLLLMSGVFTADKCNLEMVGFMNFGQKTSDITGFYQDNREFAVIGLRNGAAFVDITDPANPAEIGRIPGTYSKWRDLKYWNRYVYIGTEAHDGIKVVSVDDPDNPVHVYTITDFISSHNIYIDVDGYLYVVGSEDNFGVSLHDIWIYDLKNPALPELIGNWSEEYIHDIEVYNNKLYAAAYESGHFYILDVSDKKNPVTKVKHFTGAVNSTHDCAVTYDENYLITADERSGGHIRIWDISDYGNINYVSSFMTEEQHSVHNVYVRPETDLVIISYYLDGTRILNISDPLNPVEVGYYDTSDDITWMFEGNWGTYAYLPSGYIIASDIQNGLFILSSPLTTDTLAWNSCNPENENVCLTSYDCAGVCGGTAVLDDCSTCNVYLYPDGEPPQNQPHGICDCTGIPYGEATFDNCHICSGGTSGNEPCPRDCAGKDYGPAYLNECDTCICNGSSGSACIESESCVMGCNNQWYNDENAPEIDDCDVCGGENDDKDCNGVCNGETVIDKCDVCDGDDSSCADCAGVPNGNSVEDSCGTCDADTSNDCPALTKGNNLLIDTFEIQTIYPNPFNPTTHIKYSVPRFSKISCIIYDNLGRQVDILFHNFQSPGYYTIKLNASDYSSGIYFIQMLGDGYHETQKMIVVK